VIVLGTELSGLETRFAALQVLVVRQNASDTTNIETALARTKAVRYGVAEYVFTLVWWRGHVPGTPGEAPRVTV